MTLELNGNDLKEANGVAIARAMERKITLTKLSLGNNRLRKALV